MLYNTQTNVHQISPLWHSLNLNKVKLNWVTAVRNLYNVFQTLVQKQVATLICHMF